jgi:hypothetical protein
MSLMSCGARYRRFISFNLPGTDFKMRKKLYNTRSVEAISGAKRELAWDY